MHRSAFLAIAALGLLAAASHASEVYQWKDANGVTHYSQTPPPKGTYQQRQITNSGASTSLQETVQADASADSPRCATARANVAALSGDRAVHEAGADGTPGRALDDAERASQLELANAAVKAYCTSPAD